MSGFRGFCTRAAVAVASAGFGAMKKVSREAWEDSALGRIITMLSLSVSGFRKILCAAARPQRPTHSPTQHDITVIAQV